MFSVGFERNAQRSFESVLDAVSTTLDEGSITFYRAIAEAIRIQEAVARLEGFARWDNIIPLAPRQD
jgi:hypothetical protein